MCHLVYLMEMINRRKHSVINLHTMDGTNEPSKIPCNEPSYGRWE